jgi:hypothetical protein
VPTLQRLVEKWKRATLLANAARATAVAASEAAQVNPPFLYFIFYFSVFRDSEWTLLPRFC